MPWHMDDLRPQELELLEAAHAALRKGEGK